LEKPHKFAIVPPTSVNEHTQFVAVLEILLVESAETAVRVQIVKDFKGSK
jgi:hypothetical protein